jgi:hypothetical protein
MIATWPSWRWPAYVVADFIRDTYRSLPGPWWCKAMLVAICLAIPGPQDELLLLAIVAISRRIRARKQRR